MSFRLWENKNTGDYLAEKFPASTTHYKASPDENARDWRQFSKKKKRKKKKKVVREHRLKPDVVVINYPQSSLNRSTELVDR